MINSASECKIGQTYNRPECWRWWYGSTNPGDEGSLKLLTESDQDKVRWGMLTKRSFRSGLRAACLGLLLAFLGSVGAGCGDGASSSSGDGGFKAAAKGVRDCLLGLGARQATDVADVAFFVEDSKRGDTTQPASAANGMVEIEEYRPVRIVGNGGGLPAPDYVVWVAQPYGESDVAPVAALETDEAHTLVMYVQDPDRRQTRTAARCLHDLGTDLPEAVSG